MKSLLLFVHGFLGSEASFASFPVDLLSTLRSQHGTTDIECRTLPTFDSKGSTEAAVSHLCTWLQLNAPLAEYRSVIILAHSMGGLLAVDAYRRLVGPNHDIKSRIVVSGDSSKRSVDDEKSLSNSESKSEVTDPQSTVNTSSSVSKSWLSSFWSSSSSMNNVVENKNAENQSNKIINATSQTTPPIPTPTQDSINYEDSEFVSGLVNSPSNLTLQSKTENNSTDQNESPHVKVNIVAIIAFDSPFFGVNTSIFRSVNTSHATTLVGAPPVSIPPVPESIKNATSTAISTVSSAPSLAYKATSIAASTVSSLPSAALDTAKSATSSAYQTVSKVADNTYVKAAAKTALPTVAAVGAAAALSVVPGGLAIVSAAMPAFTWGRAAMMGVSAGVAGLSIIGADVKKREEEERALNEEFGDEKDEIMDNDEAGQDTNSKDSTKSEAIDSELQPRNDSQKREILFDSSENFESEPSLVFEKGEKAFAETAGLETAMLIAAAALADSSLPSTPAIEKNNDSDYITQSSPPLESPSKSEMGDAINRTDGLDVEIGSLLRKASKSLLKSNINHKAKIETVSPNIAEAIPPTDSTSIPTSYLNDTKNVDDIQSSDDDNVSQDANEVKSDWMPWLTLGVAGAAISAGTYYSGGLSLAAPLVQRVAVAWAMTHAKEASQHLRFLYPLWGETQKEWMARMDMLKHEVQMGRLVFRCFYIEVPERTVDIPKDESSNDASSKKIIPAQTFVSVPPQSMCHLFRPLSTDSSDAIAGHMTMFDREHNAGSFWSMLDETAKLIVKALELRSS